MKTFLLNLALPVGLVLLAIVYIRWGGCVGAESAGSRAQHVYDLMIAACITWGVVIFMRRKRRQ